MDRLALFFQSRWFSHYEATRCTSASQSLSGDDVARDGLVPLVRDHHDCRRPPLLLPSVERGRAQRRRPVSYAQMVWLVGSGLARGLCVDLSILAFARK